MASGNGFITYAPDARYGTNVVIIASAPTFDAVCAQKFVCPGSGNITVSQIGAYFNRGSDTSTNAKLGIFTHNASNYPDSLVTNSESTAFLVTTPSASDPNKYSYDYSTKPTLTGGNTYWLAVISDSAGGTIKFSIKIDYKASVTSGDTIRKDATYATWPTWSSHTDETWDTALYAIYELPPIPPFDYYYNNMRP